jgi:hypothetical protein
MFLSSQYIRTSISEDRVHSMLYLEVIIFQLWIVPEIYKIKFFPVVLYECETWSLTLMEEHRLKVFVIRVLRRIFGPGRDDVTGGWKRLHEKFQKLYSLSIMIRTNFRRMRLTGHVAHLHQNVDYYSYNCVQLCLAVTGFLYAGFPRCIQTETNRCLLHKEILNYWMMSCSDFWNQSSSFKMTNVVHLFMTDLFLHMLLHSKARGKETTRVTKT